MDADGVRDLEQANICAFICKELVDQIKAEALRVENSNEMTKMSLMIAEAYSQNKVLSQINADLKTSLSTVNDEMKQQSMKLNDLSGVKEELKKQSQTTDAKMSEMMGVMKMMMDGSRKDTGA